MFKSLCIAFFACLAVIMLRGEIAFAQETIHYPIGQIAILEGQAYTANEENRRSLKEEDPVFLGSIIETGTDSKVIILFIDDTQITLGENAELLIDEYIFDPYDSNENKAEFNVTKGAFHWVSGMLSKREHPQVKIKTSAGSIGIRGTEFWAGDLEGGYGVFVDDGLVSFDGIWGSVEMPAGSGTFVKPTTPDFIPDSHYWTTERRKMAKIRTGMKLTDLHYRLERLRRSNEQKRHDWRGKMFPHKPNPYMNLQRVEETDEFYTDEFEDTFDYNKEKP